MRIAERQGGDLDLNRPRSNGAHELAIAAVTKPGREYVLPRGVDLLDGSIGCGR